MLTTEEFTDIVIRAGRIYGPGLLFDHWHRGDIDTETVTATIGDIWGSAEYPSTAMPRASWRALFDEAGYTVDGKLAARPSDPIRLYRGALPRFARRWSWTSDLELARRFAQGYSDGGFNGRWPGHVYQIAAPPEALLCFTNVRGENEYVVDTRGLTLARLT